MQAIATYEALERFLGEDLARFDGVPPIDHPALRIGYLGDRVIASIQLGDADAARVGCLILLKDPALPFGKLVKSGLARVLRQRMELLSSAQKDAIGAKTAELLSLEFCPREVEDYCRLVRKFGQAAAVAVADAARPVNPKALRLQAYLTEG
ncbi:hypothetical protein [Chitiniphilus shinanonensis]|uniref:hypothetical protein n=1 Tax=Chitiniphilus shinanonensis TaxID=553088 RepID=UPI00305D870A